MNYIGIDGCRAGWLYIRLDKNCSYDFGLLESIKELPKIAAWESVICIDIPIGLREKDTRERLCDTEARKLLKKKGSSIFPALSRLSLDAGDYQTASELNFKFTGRKLSKQSFALSKKIKEVDDFIQTSEKKYHILECHPELCFLALNDFEPLQYSKKEKNGRAEREKILSNHLTSARSVIDKVSQRFLRKQVAFDDILDALVTAVAATFEERLLAVPRLPETDEKNIEMKIVYPPFKR